MSMMASPITSVSIVNSTICTGADQRKHEISMSLAFVKGIHQWPVNSPHKENVSIWWHHHGKVWVALLYISRTRHIVDDCYLVKIAQPPMWVAVDSWYNKEFEFELNCWWSIVFCCGLVQVKNDRTDDGSVCDATFQDMDNKWNIWHIEAGTKWLPFCRQHFHMHFLDWRYMNFN